MEISAAKLKRLASTYREYAGEAVSVEIWDSTVTVFGSELAVLRIFHKIGQHADGRVEFAKGRGAWMYAQDVECLRGNLGRQVAA